VPDSLQVSTQFGHPAIESGPLFAFSGKSNVRESSCFCSVRARQRLENGACEDWEPILLGSRYEFVHFDGLNRWYLAEERSNLKTRFEVPPNIFDGFELSTVVSLKATWMLWASRKTMLFPFCGIG